jgi:adenine deaminase
MNLTLNHLFESPTIAGLAEIVDQEQVEIEDPDMLAELLDSIEGLSEEEVQSLIQAKLAES